ncbi:MAG: bifunctional phosphoribosyl-AMP cyclohydrolase/phosphoribosyl-ATP diphosphatase HisIE [Longimicrobiales bacterium]
MRIRSSADLERVDFTRGDGLVTVIAQHARTGTVLMVAHADRDALERTLTSGEMWYWSRSRAALWRKGETSGNTQRMVALHADCDADAVLALVEPRGPSCHTGAWSCFGTAPTLPALADVIAQRMHAAPDHSYTARLLRDDNLRLKKLGEEAVELALACAAPDAAAVADEAADLLYHTLVACAGVGVGLDDVLRVLEARRSAARPAQENAVDSE